MTRRVLVLGGTGFIGARVARALREAGDEVVTLSRSARAGPEAGVLLADRTRPDAIAAVLAGRRFDATLDFAAYDRAGVEALGSVPGFSPGRYVLISTGQACLVTTAPTMPFREEDSAYPLKPEPAEGGTDHANWSYGVGKRGAEAGATELARRDGWEVLTLRLPIVLGPGDTSLRTWAHLERFLDGGPVLLPSGGEKPVRFLWVDDVARALTDVLRRWPVPSHVYHLAQPDIVPLRHVLARMAEYSGHAPEFVPVSLARLAEAGLGVECCPYSGAWVSVLDPARACAEWDFRGTPFDAYVESVVRGHLDAPPAESHWGYARRGQELELARRLKSEAR